MYSYYKNLIILQTTTNSVIVVTPFTLFTFTVASTCSRKSSVLASNNCFLREILIYSSECDNSTHDKLHSVGVGKVKFVGQLLCIRQHEWLRLRGTGEILAAGKLNLSPHYPAVCVLVLSIALVVGQDEMDMIEDVRGSLDIQLILYEGEHNGKR